MGVAMTKIDTLCAIARAAAEADPHPGATATREQADLRNARSERIILVAIQSQPRPRTYLEKATNMGRAALIKLLYTLNQAQQLHSINRGRSIYYAPGPGPWSRKRGQKPTRQEPDPDRPYPVDQAPIRRPDGRIDPAHRVVRFGDDWRSGRGIQPARNFGSTSSLVSVFADGPA